MSRPSRKRPFERRDGLLRDQYRGVDGRKVTASMPGSIVGEPVPEEERSSRRAEIGDDDELKAGSAMYALDDEHSPELLEQLLIALGKSNIAAPMRLTDYADDPRVQPALLNAVRTVPLDDVSNFAQGLGIVGGPGARDALRARMQEALADPQTFAPDPFLNFRAGAAETCAENLLCLDAEDQDAADALLQLIGHVCARNRRSAAWTAAKVVRRHKYLRTRPLRGLRAALTALIDSPEDDVFSVVAPVLWEDPRVPVRVARLLESRSRAKQLLALRAVCKVEFRGWPMLIKWASRPRDPILVLTSLGPSLRLLSDARRAEIAALGLAIATPSIRCEAASLLSSLDETVAAKLARRALKDEPDPAIRTQLTAFVKKPARRPKRVRRRFPARKRR